MTLGLDLWAPRDDDEDEGSGEGDGIEEGFVRFHSR